MDKIMKNLPKITLYALLIVSVIISVMFWVGGSSDVVINGETWNEPTYTGLYLNWAYVLAAIALCLTIIIAIVRFMLNFVANPKKGLSTLLVLLVFAGVFVIAWAMGSDARLDIIGYDGTDNEGVMARYSDMCLYAAYILAGGTIVSLIVTAIYAKFK